jgi:6-phosphofructokinase
VQREDIRFSDETAGSIHHNGNKRRIRRLRRQAGQKATAPGSSGVLKPAADLNACSLTTINARFKKLSAGGHVCVSRQGTGRPGRWSDSGYQPVHGWSGSGSRKFRSVELIYGAVHGVRGILDEDFYDLTQETTHNLEMVANTPSSALGSTRDKPDLKYCQEIFKVLRAHEIGYFFYTGGNDSSDTVRIVNDEARKAGYDLRCIHIPKTIDNDLVENDHTPGFPSAARYVAQAFMGINLDNAALPGIYIGVVMGRHAGFLTAASALGKKFSDDGPHLIYMPERPFEIDEFLRDVKQVYDRLGRCIVAVSEGIHDGSGQPIIARLAKEVERDAHGNVQLSGSGALADLLTQKVKEELQITRVRGDTLGYIQRSFVGCVSDVDQNEAREVGEKAVQYGMFGDRDGSVTIKRTGHYSVDYELVPLELVAGKTRTMPDAFISASGHDVTDAFRQYLRPLLGSGMPDAYRLRPNKVPKILAERS